MDASGSCSASHQWMVFEEHVLEDWALTGVFFFPADSFCRRLRGSRFANAKGWESFPG